MKIDFDLVSLFEFLTNTPESGLRKMLVEKNFTDVHFNLLIKIVKNTDLNKFQQCVESDTFPTIRMNPNEAKLKEIFWKDLYKVLSVRGLLQPSLPQKIAA